MIDVRSADEFADDHFDGALNIPATNSNTISMDSMWYKDLLTKCPDKDMCLYIYGSNSFEVIKSIGENTYKLGYKNNKPRIYTGKYEDLKRYMEER